MKHHDTPHLEHLETSPLVLQAVYCHHCGVIIQGLVYDDDPIATHEINDKKIHHHIATMSPYPMYDEVTVKMHDGSKHVMAFCRSCAHLVTLDQIKDYYRRDVAAWRRENHTHRDLGWLDKRVPVEIVKRGA